MKRTRHGNRRSHRKIKRYHAQRRKEEKQWEAIRAKMLADWDAFEKIGRIASRLLGGVFGYAYGWGMGRGSL